MVLDPRSSPGVESYSLLMTRASLLSAAHLLAYKSQHAVPLYIPTGEATFEDIEGDLITPRDSDKFDIAVLRLSERRAQALESVGLHFVRAAQTFPINPAALPDGGFIVYGYPEEGSHRDRDHTLVPVPHYLGCVPYRGPTHDLGNYDPASHALLSFKRHEVVNQRTGAIESFPHPGGMSGCGVWWAYSRDEVGRHWNPDSCRLVGVQSSWYQQSGALKAIPVARAIELIANRWPELRQALSVAGPPRSP